MFCNFTLNMTYKSVNGKEYTSYSEYCNSTDLDDDIIGVMLATGRRTPQNEYEQELLNKIIKLKSEGIGVEFPS